MVSKYLKALALTIILLSLGLLLISYLDQLRFNSISDSIEETALDVQSTQQLLLYESVFGEDQDICGILNDRVGIQIDNMQKAFRDFEQASSQNFLSNPELLKRRFLNQNIELYLLVEKARRDCGNEDILPILYFYTENSFVAEEASQAKVLDSVVQECPNVRVFALPHDLGIPVIEAILESHSITKYPSLVVNNEKIDFLVSSEEILSKITCKA